MNIQPDLPKTLIDHLETALSGAGFRGDIETDTALRAAMSTDNSVYRIRPDLVVAPRDGMDVVTLLAVLEAPEFAQIPLTARGGGTGTNGQSLNRGIIVDMRRHMHRLIAVNPEEMWADVEPGMVLDDLNARLRPMGLFFAPEASTSTRCTIGGMVSTDASGKGSRIYGKTSDNLIGVELACAEGLLSSLGKAPDWAHPMLADAEAAGRAGRDAFVSNTVRLNRRFTGYDLERAFPDAGGFDWMRLFPGSEGTLGPITKIRVALRKLPKEKRLVVAGFDSFRNSLAAAGPLLAIDPTAIEVMDERVQALAENAGLLTRLPAVLQAGQGEPIAYTFIEINGDDPLDVDEKIRNCTRVLAGLPGIKAHHIAGGAEEIRDLWAIRSAGVGLLGKVEGRARPVAFVEDCVVPPDALPSFLDGFLEILKGHDLDFGIYGHVDVGCLHIRPALDIDAPEDRVRLKQVSDEIFALVVRHGGIFWGEHGKGVRGAYLREWIGDDAYRALQGIKAAFDPRGRYNPGKLVTRSGEVMGIDTTPFRPFNSVAGDPLEKAFRCNGNAQCLSYAAATPMCPSFKATGDLRHSPKGRADALRAWREDPESVDTDDLLQVMESCLGCKACASSCPVQVDIPTMRAAFYAQHYKTRTRPLGDRLTLMAERFAPVLVKLTGIGQFSWPVVRWSAERIFGFTDMPRTLAKPVPAKYRLSHKDIPTLKADRKTVLIWLDWFSALFDGDTLRDVLRGFEVLGYAPRVVDLLPSGKLAHDLGDTATFDRMATNLCAALASAKGLANVGLDPAFVMALRQDYPKAGHGVPDVLLPQEFLSREIAAGATFPKGRGKLRLFLHCTESTGASRSRSDWATVLTGIGVQPDLPQTGCCGMAGLFGHKTQNSAVSTRLWDMSWKDLQTTDTPSAATGFSCRCQAERMGGAAIRHPLGLIADMMDQS